ncbi:MAG: hypothetical protein IJM08_07485 [Firmicutes bacterium]|nr:hypothetical protein [Bacillota bacterium]
MFVLHGIKIRAGKGSPEGDELRAALLASAEKKLGVKAGSLKLERIVKESLDAREKPDIYRVFSLGLSSDAGTDALSRSAEKRRLQYSLEEEKTFSFGKPARKMAHRPIVCGFGPCGIFAALVLAELGLKPIVLERGSSMEKRMEAVERFWSEGTLDPCTNVQFGEGGAGSFSDGKLTTGTRDASQRYILEQFVAVGAPEDILCKHHPHIGTDVLRGVVVNLREKIKALGGEVLFDTELKSLDIRDGRLAGVTAGDNEYFPADTLILALGHSARNTVRELHSEGIYMEPKPFSMGVRIEHPQELIDIAQYGAPHQQLGLPAAEYKLNCRTSSGRGVYSFCMCPGGYVVASASETGGLVTNGMSNRARDNINANSALLADVRPEDFPDPSDPLSGMELQEKHERLAFELGGSSYRAPAQYLAEFMAENASDELPVSAENEALILRFGLAKPSYRPGVSFTDIEKCLPGFVSDALKEALPVLGRKLKGFDYPGALLTAIESRSSAPFRIKRTAEGLAMDGDGNPIEGLYPGGEGAGYAGGIMSAAADGVRLALLAAGAVKP